MANKARLSVWNRLASGLNLPGKKSPGDRFLKLAAEAREHIREIPAADAARAVESGSIFIDVRERGEYAQRHAMGAEQLSRGLIELESESLAPDPDTPIICYCSGGNRSALVAENLQRMGYQNVRVIDGGLKAWIASGLPTSSEREAMD